jgi:hypothetical protein
MAPVPHRGPDPGSKIVGRAIPDNAEVANRNFGKLEGSRSRLCAGPEVLEKPLPMSRQSRQLVHADRQTTRRPGIDQRDDPQRRGPLVPAGCGCRNHGHPDTAAHHLANCFEPREADTQFQPTAGAGGVVFHLILESVPGREANIVIGKRIAKCDRAVSAHHMISWRDQHEPVFGKWKGLQFFGGVDLVPNDADLGEVSGNSAHNVAAGTLPQIDIDLGCCDRNAARTAGRNSALAVVLARRRTRPLKPSAYSDNSPRIRSNC